MPYTVLLHVCLTMVLSVFIEDDSKSPTLRLLHLPLSMAQTPDFFLYVYVRHKNFTISFASWPDADDWRVHLRTRTVRMRSLQYLPCSAYQNCMYQIVAMLVLLCKPKLYVSDCSNTCLALHTTNKCIRSFQCLC